jgi:hypothetical protein
VAHIGRPAGRKCRCNGSLIERGARVKQRLCGGVVVCVLVLVNGLKGARANKNGAPPSLVAAASARTHPTTTKTTNTPDRWAASVADV